MHGAVVLRLLAFFSLLVYPTLSTDHILCCVQVLAESYEHRATLWNNYECPKFIPFNPVDKYTIAVIRDLQTGEMMRVMKGAPQVLICCPAHVLLQWLHFVNCLDELFWHLQRRWLSVLCTYTISVLGAPRNYASNMWI